ncbi:HlyD family secretion protein [Haoranjiania flava]|uniref:Efflux RND transporter periplasmic adaptor subunit n=1 Tax=Haoranjiania flava TaxID=1856322 RepID=A0AAE3IS36_9BACT|nr:efflux RND transporter periplasmic adaptor subunit [Haoranjiania flava]MCU7694757.1 efflux RND transporter periplasmic adaptor subunit [Haoranjiania flava]
MKQKGFFLLMIGLAVFIGFIIFSFVVINKPQPLEVQGEVDAKTIKVASKLVGRISNLTVHKGDTVRQGQLLYTFSSPELDAKMTQASAALLGAEAQNSKAMNGAQSEDIQAAYDMYQKALTGAELARKTFERVNSLYKDGVVPAQKKDEAEAQYQAAMQTANAAKATWQKARNGARTEDKMASGAMVKNARGMIQEVNSYKKETSIYAPLSAEVADIIAEEGELVSAGYPVVTLVDLEDIWVVFNLREDLLADISAGSVINARFPALKNRLVPLKVTYIKVLGQFATWNATKTSGDFDMKTFEVHAVPVNAVRGLRPGMSAVVNWNDVRNKKS